MERKDLSSGRTTAIVFVLLASVYSQELTTQLSNADRVHQAKQALEYVERVETAENCSGGTGNTLQLAFDTTAWETHTSPAIRTANFLSQFLAAQGSNTLDSLDDSFFYDFVRNNVHGDTLIFGSAIALESDIISRYDIFCPYASKYANLSGVRAFDLATSYNYRSPDTDWYQNVKVKDFSQVAVVTDTVEGRVRRQPIADYSHGSWTYPYYDCGGGDVWMVTFSAPILALGPAGTPAFKGVATIDLELTNIDVNQCDVMEGANGGSLDVFRGTHNCQPTTMCVPVVGQGFRRGSYLCQCLDGYYFPNTTDSVRAFRGYVLDHFYDTHNVSTFSDRFRCLPCSRACETCVDDTPCLYEYMLAVRSLVAAIVALLVACCMGLAFFTYKYRMEMVMKTASPIFLQIMIGAAVLMCTSVLLMYPEPTDLLCTIFIWPFHIGFVLLYGSLIIKTWRISVIFSSRRKVKLPDIVLLKRLLPLPLIMVVYLSCWTSLEPPHVMTIAMPDSRKFFSCSFNYWNYAVFGAEALLLLFGVYLCFTVRKAPAHFNESKHITWSTYNAIILGTFIITLTRFMRHSSGPDMMYVLLMTQLHVFVTITLALIFAPKFWALHKGTNIVTGSSITGRPRMLGTLPTVDLTGLLSKSVQVNLHDLPPLAKPSNTLCLRPSGKESGELTPNRPSAGVRSNKIAPARPSAADPSEGEPHARPGHAHLADDLDYTTCREVQWAQDQAPGDEGHEPATEKDAATRKGKDCVDAEVTTDTETV